MNDGDRLFAQSKENDPRPFDVVPFDGHESDKDQHQYRRDQNGVYQCQPFPHHMHEHRNDKPRLQDHEQQNERPPQVTLEFIIIDKIREGTENEK